MKKRSDKDSALIQLYITHLMVGYLDVFIWWQGRYPIHLLDSWNEFFLLGGLIRFLETKFW